MFLFFFFTQFKKQEKALDFTSCTFLYMSSHIPVSHYWPTCLLNRSRYWGKKENILNAPLSWAWNMFCKQVSNHQWVKLFPVQINSKGKSIPLIYNNFVGILIFIRKINFLVSWAEHRRSFIIWGHKPSLSAPKNLGTLSKSMVFMTPMGMSAFSTNFAWQR